MTTEQVDDVNEILAKVEQWYTQPQEVYHRKECCVPRDSWTVVLEPDVLTKKRVSGWSYAEKSAIADGILQCPMCQGKGYFVLIERGILNYTDGTTEEINRRVKKSCECKSWRYVQNLVKSELSLYDYVDLWTLKPSARSILTKERQQQELDYLRQHSSESFLFHGPSGTGKTTFSQALYRHAFMRNAKKFWDEKNGVPKKLDVRWIWSKNFSTLLQEFNTHLWDREKPEPSVTPEEIQRVASLGYPPFLSLEEIDKIDLNNHRINFLLALIDETLKAKGGRVVVTTNFTSQELWTYLTGNKDLEASGIPIIRRLLDTVNVRNYF